LGFDENSFYSAIEYSHLTLIDIADADIGCVVQFLLERRTHLLRLTELKVNYHQLKTVTMNFTRDETRRYCSKVERFVLFQAPIVVPREVCEYFS